MRDWIAVLGSLVETAHFGPLVNRGINMLVYPLERRLISWLEPLDQEIQYAGHPKFFPSVIAAQRSELNVEAPLAQETVDIIGSK